MATKAETKAKKPLSLAAAVTKIMSRKSGKKQWYPYELQKEIKRITGKMYSESSITAVLRRLHIKARPRDKGRIACPHYYVHPNRL